MIGTFYVGQIPKDNLVFTVQDQHRNVFSLGAYTSVELHLIDSDGNATDLSSNTNITDAASGTVVFVWPSTSIFDKAGDYEFQLAFETATGKYDLTSVYGVKVLERGVHKV